MSVVTFVHLLMSQLFLKIYFTVLIGFLYSFFSISF